METIVALFDDRNDAYKAVNALIEANVERQNISLLSSDPEGEFQEELIDEVQEDHIAEGAARGAVGGGILGGIIGTAIGLGSFAIPGIGPFIGAGTLVAALSGLGIGAASGTLYGALVSWGASEMDASYYAEGIRRGGTLVAVKVAEGSVDYVSDILEEFNPVDIEERAANWRETGWTPQDIGYSESEQVVRDDNAAGLYDSHTDYSNDRAFRFEDYGTDFERHYNDIYAETGTPYISYEPAYQYGYNVARDMRFRERDWDEIEDTVRDEWGTKINTNDRPWDEVKEAVNYAWAKVKNSVTDLTDSDNDYDSFTVDEDSDYEPLYREHYDTYYLVTGLPYNYYHTYYIYGTRVAEDDVYDDDDWDLVEDRVRADWTRDYGDGDNTWEDIKDAVRRGWEAVVGWTDDNDYDPSYREHYNTYYSSSGRPYDYYMPYYQYGTSLAQSDTYDDDDWDVVENRVREDWNREYGDGDSTWEDIKDAVRRGWESVTDWADGDEYDEDYDPTYRAHYDNYYMDRGYPYDYYLPYYEYGSELAQSDMFDDDDWDLVEGRVQEDWNRTYSDGDSTWEDVKDAVRRGWEAVKESVSDWTDDDEYDDTYYQQYDPHFNEHYNTYYAGLTRPYAYYRPAYHYGIDVARSREFGNQDWDYIEPTVRSNWERQYTPEERAWDDVRDAIRYGWTQIRTVA